MSDPSVSSIPITALDRPIAYHRIFRTITGKTVAALFLSQAYYWSLRVPEGRDGWFYKTKVEWEQETGLSETEQGTARKTLKQLGVLEDELRGLPAKLWYRVDAEALAELIRSHTTNKIGGPIASSSEESSDLDTVIPTNIHTEITAETTTENTLSADAENDADEAARDRARILVHGFITFYEAYPRKEGRAAALRAWEKAARAGKITPENTQAIIRAMREQKANNFKFRDKKYIPLPASWINGERWDDEIIQPQGPKVELIDRHGNFTVEGAAAHARGEI